MNCKPGDIAYITQEPYLGHFVNVLRWSPPGHDVTPDGGPCDNRNGGGWMCEKHSGLFNVRSGTNGKRIETRYAVIDDAFLRPIRDSDGEDEMLRIAGKPEQITA